MDADLKAVRFERMTQNQYLKFRAWEIEEYANAIIAAEGFSRREALLESEKQFTGLLSSGRSSKDHFLWMIVVDGVAVGTLWFGLRGSKENRSGFIFSIRILDPFQGKGYGKLTLRKIEELCRKHKIKALKLHVFVNNTVAVGMYEKFGFQPTNFRMSKAIDL